MTSAGNESHPPIDDEDKRGQIGSIGRQKLNVGEYPDSLTSLSFFC